MREKTIDVIEQHKIITIVRGVEANSLIPMAEAMYDGGIRLLEITYDASGKIADKDTAKRIEMLAEHFGGRMVIGAGTVLNESQVELTQSAGGRFIISPDTCCSVIEKTRELEMISIPGALTPTEIQHAHRCGADFVKLFPINSLGVEYVKAIKAPLSHVRLLAVGGVSIDNIYQYIQVGVSGFGIGSNIIDKEAIENGDFEKITFLAKKYTEEISR